MSVARCVFCNALLNPVQLAAAGGQVQCQACKRRSTVLAMPSLLENRAAKPPPPPVDPPAEGEAACFYSPNRRATKECSHCGVLISDIWAAQWGSKSVCLKCLDHLRAKGQDAHFQTKRILWDNVALIMALVPLTVVFWWVSFITAPAAIFTALWHWNSPRSLVPRSRLRLIIALLLGLAQVGGFVFLISGWWFGWFQ